MQLSNFILENRLSEKELIELEEYSNVDKRYAKMVKIQRAVQENETKKIISLQETFDKLDQKNVSVAPKLAIAKANAFKVSFAYYGYRGTGTFSSYTKKNYQKKRYFGVENLTEEVQTNFNVDVCREYRERATSYGIPVIPIDIRKRFSVDDSYLLWEINDWQETKKDPALLQHLYDDLYAVLAVWDMTQLEYLVLK